MTLKGMRKADQQMILDTLGMDREPARSEPAGISTAVPSLPESAPLSGLTATIPKFETNTRLVLYCIYVTLFCNVLGTLY